jgi:hypothetical protein
MPKRDECYHQDGKITVSLIEPTQNRSETGHRYAEFRPIFLSAAVSRSAGLGHATLW